MKSRKHNIPQLSEEERAKRRPVKPEVLVCALQDNVHDIPVKKFQPKWKLRCFRPRDGKMVGVNWYK